MAPAQGDPALMNDPIAQELLHSTEFAHVAYVWNDGTPRVVPLWFQWTGEELVFAGPANVPRSHALRDGAPIAVSIDGTAWPYHTLLIRGKAQVSVVEGMVPEYVEAARRYFGVEQGEGWAETVRQMSPKMLRVAVRPEWVSILDFEKRFPSAIASAMAGAGAA